MSPRLARCSSPGTPSFLARAPVAIIIVFVRYSDLLVFTIKLIPSFLTDSAVSIFSLMSLNLNAIIAFIFLYSLLGF